MNESVERNGLACDQSRSLLAAALALPKAQRAQLAAELLESIEDVPGADCDQEAVDAAWAVEAERRYQAYKRGEMGSISVEEFLGRIKAK
jgi:putative addiction module component (TIGR02574 family)